MQALKVVAVHLTISCVQCSLGTSSQVQGSNINLNRLEAKAWATRFWMGKYGAKTPKRHITWCNSKHVNLLNLGRLSGWNYKSEEYEKHRTATTKVVGDKKTFQGKKKALKNSQCLSVDRLLAYVCSCWGGE